MPKEEISASEFAELKSEVRHQGSDIAEIKESTKKTTEAISSISVSLATLTAHVEQNAKLEPRIEKLEEGQKAVNKKIAAGAGGITAIGMFLTWLGKIKGIF